MNWIKVGPFVVAALCWLLLLSTFTAAITYRMWSKLEPWQWDKIECRQIEAVIVP